MRQVQGEHARLLQPARPIAHQQEVSMIAGN
jgi:hypothetical protein